MSAVRDTEATLEAQTNAIEEIAKASAALIDRFRIVGLHNVEARYYARLSVLVEAARAIGAIPEQPEPAPIPTRSTHVPEANC